MVVSDTHNQHATLGELPPGDVLLHCGDLTKGGSLSELEDFAVWWHAQPHRQKVVVAGAYTRCVRTPLRFLLPRGAGCPGAGRRPADHTFCADCGPT